FWAVVIEYLDSIAGSRRGPSDRIDYKNVLSEAEFEVFRRLRELRKKIGEVEGKPVYTIFTNAQLAAMVQAKGENKEQLRQIDGVGDAKVERYGDQVLRVIKEGRSETGQ
ncbi:MAG: HRDC domain-containing protein, partial [Planctomycetota bacterium]|nr:HRDC domain-containing protein [Planctomycetota bacterium]